MRASNSLLKWVMSATLFVLLLVVVGTKNALAQNQVATLQHNDSITGAFYGPNALTTAYDAAVDGDIITLSSGAFNSPDNDISIYKKIILRGAGCTYDTLSNVSSTIIRGRFMLYTSDVCIEGIDFVGQVLSSGKNSISFTKCYINTISPVGGIKKEGKDSEING